MGRTICFCLFEHEKKVKKKAVVCVLWLRENKNVSQVAYFGRQS